MSELQREIRFEPGYDHRADADPKQRQYGCHGMNLRFLLHGEKGSVQFLVYTGWLPGQNMLSKTALSPMGADVGYHCDAPQYEGQTRRVCDLRPTGHCYYDGSGRAADDLFAEFTTSGEAAVWRTLHERYADLSAPAEDEPVVP